MFESIERLTRAEMNLRHARVKQLFNAKYPQANGILVFSALNIYYLTGTFSHGVLYIPMEGEPTLLMRKGIERAKLETSLNNLASFKSYGEIINILESFDSSLGKIVGAEMGGLTWAMSNMLKSKLKDIEFIDVSIFINKARAVKTEYEKQKMRIAGERHLESYKAIAQKIHPLMTEREIFSLTFEEFLKRDHAGLVRNNSLGSENVLGQMGVGDNLNYPSPHDGPCGYKGGHPAAPYFGSQEKWEKNSLLVLDLGFSYQGYITDKTQVFWSGSKSTLPDYFKRAFDVCLEIQNTAANSLQAGAIPEMIWQKSLGIVKNAGLTENYMGHGSNQVKFLGHGIGLAFDEFPPIANKIIEPIEANMFIALEPKMGFEGLGMVGLENVFEVTETGAKSITGTDFELICID